MGKFIFRAPNMSFVMSTETDTQSQTQSSVGPAEPPSTEPAETDAHEETPLIDYAAPAGILLGTLLPWASVNAGIFSQSMTGLDTDFGMLTAVAALALIGLTYSDTVRPRLHLAVAALAVVLPILQFGLLGDAEANAAAESAGTMFEGAIQVSAGIGLWLSLAAAVAATYLAYQNYKTA